MHAAVGLNWRGGRLDSQDGCFLVWFVVGSFVALGGSVGLGSAAWGAVFLMAGWGVMNSRWGWALFCMGICGVGSVSTGAAWDRRI